MIDLQNIEKTYTRPDGTAVRALADVSLHIERGEFVALVGTSGSGKSTLMNILGSLDQPTAGRYLFEDIDIARLDIAAQARFRNRRLGFVFQAFHLLPRASALENVELPLLYAENDPPPEAGRRALESVGLAARMRHSPTELSGGQQQRVAIARALVNQPELLLADEPTGNLDPQSAREILDLFEALNRSGRTIVLVTHDPAVAERARRVVRLDSGRVASDETRPTVRPVAAKAEVR
jgi:ABC-type lipoprotein export system ATPase subunit